MKTKKYFHKKLISLDGKRTDSYTALTGEYDFDGFVLTVDYVPGDSERLIARLRARLPFDRAKFPRDVFNTKSRAIGACDYIARQFGHLASKLSFTDRRIKGGRISIERPGREILETNAIVAGKESIEARFTVELPHRQGKIASTRAIEMLIDRVPKLVTGALTFRFLDGEELADWIETCEDADAARSQLADRGLVAFIADGSILVRRAPASITSGGGLESFVSPDDLAVNIELPNKGSVRGMGVPEGITLVTGGASQGKSTLLSALELGVYNHIPGDGCELVVTRADAVSIRSEAGRPVQRVNIAPFAGAVRNKADMSVFSTPRASGFDSLAANVMESLEVGTSLFLFDEDDAAEGLMTRDARMQALVPKEDEPSSSLIDILPLLWEKQNISAVLAAGASGDWFDVADTVILMKGFKARSASGEARNIACDSGATRAPEPPVSFPFNPRRIPLGQSLDPRKEGGLDPRPEGKMIVQYGDSFVDLSGIGQLVSTSQVHALSRSLALVYRFADSGDSIGDIIRRIMTQVEQVGLDTLSSRLMGDLAMFRAHELASAVNRLRQLKVK